MYVRISFALVLLVSGFLTGCGILYPDEAAIEYPQPEDITDPFHFSNILEGTNKHFNKLNRQDMFHENFLYDANDGQVFSRTSLFDRFDRIVQRYFRDDPSDTTVLVSWIRPAGVSDPLMKEGEPATIYRDYIVTMRTVADSGLVEWQYEGAARFELRFHYPKNTWTIYRWRDDHASPGLTFFHPEFHE